MRITVKGQVTIPQNVRDYSGFQPGTEVEFLIGDDGVVRVIAVNDEARNARLDAVINDLSASADSRLTTEEIMALTRE